MHADERNRAMSEGLGEDIYHYHLHVVYVPVVEKQVLWTKRCKLVKLKEQGTYRGGNHMKITKENFAQANPCK